ncbi:enoyl-CoA hydratase/isomerase family protein [Prauserella cavernicola]|uniref:Enoyl-CoA hydratase/isomerase family protein n=1 Tax=Prauserella cavernicola TaxID=2800127 RepID=A0A934QXI2_9PSEU|nr:enoyl-CoA hydratase/isomerase family protein [Prauserella cavernicola]MBK1788520.1 enoyl-CoA hydratase/isomerase family protein [Prauserella cavernicola]
MTSIHLEPADGVAVLRIEHGKANALDTELCRDLVARLDALAGDDTYRAVVLTGTGGVFSAGVDLKRIADGGAEYVAEFLPALSDAFLSVFDFPRPVVAAVNGHAIAGGCVLAAASDHRVMNSEHGRIGLTELLVGVPFPLVATEVVRCAYGTQRLPALTYTGQTLRAADALSLGVVDEVTGADQVLPSALEVARTLGTASASAFAHTKNQIHRPYRVRISEQRASDDARVEELWSAPETLAAIKEYVRSVLG